MDVILGISAFFHDSAAALIIEGKIVAAAQEERFSRIKNDASFPINAIIYVLQEAGIEPGDVSAVAFYEKPLLKFERLLETYHAFVPKGITSFLKAMPIWLKEKVVLHKRMRQELKGLGVGKVPLYFPEHHLSHAASAFFPSPFESATIVTMDGVGEWATMSICIGEGHTIKVLREQHFPHSVGLLYSAFTYYLGFKVNSGEYKVMGLAAYGDPDDLETKAYLSAIKEHMVDIRDEGSMLLNMEYFNFATGLTMTHDKRWEKLFGIKRRTASEELQQCHANLSFALQRVVEEIVEKSVITAIGLTNNENLVMAGGVALNGVVNGKLLHLSAVKNLWIQPASGDAGGALGAALAVYHIMNGNERIPMSPDGMQGAYLGPSFSQNQIETSVSMFKNTLRWEQVTEEEMVSRAIEALIAGKIIGWFQGRMEFGPRALGNRSILADPRHPNMQQKINENIKFRESFRPFAPCVLAEDAATYFDLDHPSPYMSLVRKVSEKIRKYPDKPIGHSLMERLSQIRSDIPSVTHVDHTARIQTVDQQTNPLFWKLLMAFKERTGCSVLINTSFNIKDEPIVCGPKDAVRCFLETEMDMLVLNNTVCYKKDGAEHEKS